MKGILVSISLGGNKDKNPLIHMEQSLVYHNSTVIVTTQNDAFKTAQIEAHLVLSPWMAGQDYVSGSALVWLQVLSAQLQGFHPTVYLFL